VRAIIPENSKRVGFLGSGDDIEISLWRPFSGRRSVANLTPAQGTLPLVDAMSSALTVSSGGPKQLGGDSAPRLPPYQKAGSVFAASRVRQGSVEGIVYLQDPGPHSFLPLVP
jgi:hypothetical protein